MRVYRRTVAPAATWTLRIELAAVTAVADAVAKSAQAALSALSWILNTMFLFDPAIAVT